MKDALSKVPVIRLLLPFITGILCASCFNIPTYIAIIIIVISIVTFSLANFKKVPYVLLTQQYIVNTPLILICFSLSIICTNLSKPSKLPEINYEGATANAIIQKITDNDFSTNLLLDVIQVTDSCGHRFNTNTKIIAWMEGNNYSLREGDLICFKFIPQTIKNKGNPEEFDYKAHLYNQGIIYHTYIKQNEYIKTGSTNNLFILSRNIQRNLITHILNSTLKPDTKTFIITIILGDSTFFSDETRDVFSQAGLAHVLALSGLHMGIIALLTSIILLPLDYCHQKRIRLILTLILIIIFSFIVGFSPSVARASIMITFILISRIIRRNSSSLNALFTAALIILLMEPYAIYNAGFQFSFLSVLLILLLSNRLTSISVKNQLQYYFGSLAIVSIITSIGTAGLTVFYFNYIPPLSIVSNIILIPLLPIIVGCGMIYLLLLVTGLDISTLAQIVDSLYEFALQLATDITSFSFPNVNYLYCSPLLLCFYFSVVISVIMYIYKHKAFYIYCALCFSLGCVLLKSVENNNIPNSGYVIFSDNQCTPIMSFSNNSAKLIIPEDTICLRTFKRTHRRFLAKYQITELYPEHQSNKQYIILGNKKVCIIKDTSIKSIQITPKIDVDIILVTKGFYGKIYDLIRNYNTKLILLSADIYHKQREKLYQECLNNNVPCHIIEEHGAVYEFFN